MRYVLFSAICKPEIGAVIQKKHCGHPTFFVGMTIKDKMGSRHIFKIFIFLRIANHRQL